MLGFLVVKKYFGGELLDLVVIMLLLFEFGI